jgi:hypothetical protein
MRYLVARSPYGNGSSLVQTLAGSADEYILYCACGMPAAASRWRSNETKVCAVSKAAHARGYGMNDEIYLIHQNRDEWSSKSKSKSVAMQMKKKGRDEASRSDLPDAEDRLHASNIS